jgi:hypothetical protein
MGKECIIIFFVFENGMSFGKIEGKIRVSPIGVYPKV